MQPVPSLHFLIKAEAERERDVEEIQTGKKSREKWPDLWVFVKYPKQRSLLHQWMTLREEKCFCKRDSVMWRKCDYRRASKSPVNTLGVQKTAHQSSTAGGDSRLQTWISHFHLLDIKDWSTVLESWDLSQDWRRNVSKLRRVIRIYCSYAPLPL